MANPMLPASARPSTMLLAIAAMLLPLAMQDETLAADMGRPMGELAMLPVVLCWRQAAWPRRSLPGAALLGADRSCQREGLRSLPAAGDQEQRVSRHPIISRTLAELGRQSPPIPQRRGGQGEPGADLVLLTMGELAALAQRMADRLDALGGLPAGEQREALDIAGRLRDLALRLGGNSPK